MRTRAVTGIVIWCLIVGALTTRAVADDAGEAVKKEVAALKGDWKILSRIADGKATPAKTIKDRVITFEDGKYTLRDGKEIYASATFKIDPSKDPKWFDLTITTADSEYKGKTQLGIYKVNGDRLTFCIADFDAKRPTDFTAKKGSGRILTTYRKQKK
jgi:uncharacterized protein (TIGR03067 family)